MLTQITELTRSLLALLPGRVAILDRDGTIVAVNGAWAEYVRLMKCGEMPAEVGTSYVDVCLQTRRVTPEEAQRAAAGVRAALGTGRETFRMDYHLVDEARWFNMLVLPLDGPKGGALVLHSEDTERKRDQAALREAESRYRHVVESTAAGYLLIDRAGRLVEANREFLRLLGRSDLAPLVGRPATDLVAADCRCRFAQAVAAAFAAGEPQHLELDWLQPGGEVTPVALNASVLQLGGLPHLAIFCLDLTAQRRAISALETSEERYRAVVEAQTELVCRYLPDTTLTFVNAAYCRFFQKTHEELIGHKFIEFLPENIRGWAMEMIDALMTRKTPITTEHEVVGGSRCVQWIDLPVLDKHGNIVELQSIGRDVTDRRQAEAALHRTHQEMRRLADRLMSAQEEERRRIARELHDDLSQRLAALAVGLSNLRRVVGTNNLAATRVARLEREAIEVGDLIRALSHQLHPAVLEQLGLPGAVQSFVSEFGARTGLRCQVEIAPRFPDLPADLALSIYRVAQEVLNNVARHAHASQVLVVLGESEQNIRVEIKDDGVGFDAHRSRGGWGLGLISIEERVSFFRGQLVIESQPGQGTRVLLTIPLGLRAEMPADDTRLVNYERLEPVRPPEALGAEL